MIFADALDKALCLQGAEWWFESKYGGAPLSPSGVTWTLDRLWRILDPAEPLAESFQRIKLHRMRPWEWTESIPMHVHAFGAVVVGLGEEPPSSRSRPYVHTVAAPFPSDRLIVPSRGVSGQVFGSVPFVYRIDRGGEHSVGFGSGVPTPYYTVTLIPRQGLPFAKWPPGVGDVHLLADFRERWVYELVSRFAVPHESRRMTDSDSGGRS